MQELGKQLANRFDLEISSMVPFRDGFILHDNNSQKMLIKKIPYSTNRIQFVHNVKEHLYKKGFSTIDRFRCSVDGTPYTQIDGSSFTLTKILNGRECNFDDRSELVSAVRALAKMHKASKGFVIGQQEFEKNNLGKLPLTFHKRVSDIKKMKKNAKKGRSKFDYLFLDYVDYFINLAEEAIVDLNNSQYQDLVKRCIYEGAVCHHDYTHNNIIVGKESPHIINFDSCCLELEIYDLANLIRRKMRKCAWNYLEAQILVQEYHREKKLTKDEIEVLMIMLKFPQKFWRVANKFYNSRQSWSEKVYVGKLYEVIEEIAPHKEMLHNIDKNGFIK